jgi:hypothetical protein
MCENASNEAAPDNNHLAIKQESVILLFAD